ncbi:MAG: flagellar biosynthetic protein FliR [Spirochaetaceae bacterium]|jgi:flagellar biosynthetic protein FliR|nr:flagellar biosynthetic protein FliR [Spirochaetaceae bacterium]GMO26865.1 MAG: flagellar biosynthetic protein FliR [Termitinemataceae bacterium]
MIAELLANAPVFILIAARALVMIEIAPIISSESVPQMAKIALAGWTAFVVFPQAVSSGNYALQGIEGGAFSFSFILLVIGEGVIGLILGFFLTMIFAAFSTGGQFFSLQMGFGASETFDPLAQIENPLMGQFLNLIAMLIFLVTDGLRNLFLTGFFRSIEAINIVKLVEGREALFKMMAGGLSGLFLNAMIISMPILGTLFLVSLATGLISKAAPQINILSEGFPISITVAFVLIYLTIPFMLEAFIAILNSGFTSLETLYSALNPAAL